jgi:MoaA/NifB/PqqE/SkfB family radical SAM enzyme
MTFDNDISKNAEQKTNASGQREDIHMGEPGLLHKLFRRRSLEGIFLFITSKCNSKCLTCFYHERINGKNDLSFQEIQKLSKSAPSFDKLWLSGGEPFMRKELVEIIKLFYLNNGIKVINLPTNGILGDKIENDVARLLDECPDLMVHLNFSLDGLGESHDKNRGIPGNFKKTITIMEKMRKKYRGHPRFLQNAVTVITPDAYDELIDLGIFLLKKDLIATHFYEVVRSDPRDPSTKRLTPESLALLRKRTLPLIRYQGGLLFENFMGLKKKLATIYFEGFIKFVNDIQDKNFTGPRSWGMKCVAGKTTLVIDSNGDFRSCEMRPHIGNVRDYACDTNAVLNSVVMNDEIEAVGGGHKANCWCTHGCWVMSSVKFSPRAILFRIPLARRRFNRECDTLATLPDIDMTMPGRNAEKKDAKAPKKKSDTGKNKSQPAKLKATRMKTAGKKKR